MASRTGSTPAEGPPDTTPGTAATAQSRGEESGSASGDVCKDAEETDTRPPIKFIPGERVKQAAAIQRYERKPDDPIYRPLKIYTVDPSRHRDEGQTALINIPFEPLEKGPVGFRFEVQKVGRSPLKTYPDVDLNEPNLLITNGHDPAPTDPVFHHQMVYAVAMSTYAVFRTALGRQISWAFPQPRLKLIPHAFKDANAQYSRGSGTLSFGWYKVAKKRNVDLPPGAVIYACLSHDIIVHELTHALLDGLRVQFNESTNPDVSAFHEAFADLVALLLRFSYPSVVQNIILRTNGDLKNKNSDWLDLVFELAQGKGDHALRGVDLDGTQKYNPTTEMHELGTVLVSAIIDAFVTIYTRKAAPMIRMASGRRSGLADEQAMSADLLAQLTHTASRLSSHLLTMCIRAIDYCPPVDITLGEYLRALITADRDLVPDDPWAYREALIDAFRKRHIFPGQVDALTEDALLWKPPEKAICIPELNFGNLKFLGDPGRAADGIEAQRQADLVGKTVCRPANLKYFGLADPKDPAGYKGDELGDPVVESVRTSRRVGPDGQLSFDLVAEVVQRRKVQRPGRGEFDFLGGATLILGSEGQVRYVIAKNIRNEARINRQFKFIGSDMQVVHALHNCRYQKQPVKAGAAAAARRRSAKAPSVRTPKPAKG
jgi:hypothetical protein